jgi:hypothetical protein
VLKNLDKKYILDKINWAKSLSSLSECADVKVHTVFSSQPLNVHFWTSQTAEEAAPATISRLVYNA